MPRVALVLWHDQQYVLFVPKVAPSKHWVAKILVKVLYRIKSMSRGGVISLLDQIKIYPFLNFCYWQILAT